MASKLSGNALHILTGLSIVGLFVTYLVDKNVPATLQTLTFFLVGGSTGVSLPTASSPVTASSTTPPQTL